VPQSDPHHPGPTRLLTRRATLGSAAALTGALSASLAGCEWGPPDQVDAPEAKQDSDDKLAKTAAGQIGGALQLVVSAPKSYPSLTATLAPLLAVHRAHLLVLDPKGTMTPTSAGPAELTSGSAATALAEIRSVELALQRGLATDAAAATSGQLARTLASMAAAVAQQLVLLPTRLDPTTAGATR
jgi:ABC-type xylose transport system permease subunit